MTDKEIELFSDRAVIDAIKALIRNGGLDRYAEVIVNRLKKSMPSGNVSEHQHVEHIRSGFRRGVDEVLNLFKTVCFEQPEKPDDKSKEDFSHPSDN